MPLSELTQNPHPPLTEATYSYSYFGFSARHAGCTTYNKCMLKKKKTTKTKRWKESNGDNVPDSLGTVFFLPSCIISLDHLSQTGLPTSSPLVYSGLISAPLSNWLPWACSPRPHPWELQFPCLYQRVITPTSQSCH